MYDVYDGLCNSTKLNVIVENYIINAGTTNRAGLPTHANVYK